MSKELYVVVRVEDGEVSVEHFDNLGAAQYYGIQCEYWALYNYDDECDYVRTNISDDKMSAYYDMYHFDGRDMKKHAIQWKIFSINLDSE